MIIGSAFARPTSANTFRLIQGAIPISIGSQKNSIAIPEFCAYRTVRLARAEQRRHRSDCRAWAQSFDEKGQPASLPGSATSIWSSQATRRRLDLAGCALDPLKQRNRPHERVGEPEIVPKLVRKPPCSDLTHKIVKADDGFRGIFSGCVLQPRDWGLTHRPGTRLASSTTSSAGLSSRTPRKDACRINPSVVHVRNSTSAANSGISPKRYLTPPEWSFQAEP